MKLFFSQRSDVRGQMLRGTRGAAFLPLLFAVAALVAFGALVNGLRPGGGAVPSDDLTASVGSLAANRGKSITVNGPRPQSSALSAKTAQTSNPAPSCDRIAWAKAEEIQYQVAKWSWFGSAADLPAVSLAINTFPQNLSAFPADTVKAVKNGIALWNRANSNLAKSVAVDAVKVDLTELKLLEQAARTNDDSRWPTRPLLMVGDPTDIDPTAAGLLYSSHVWLDSYGKMKSYLVVFNAQYPFTLNPPSTNGRAYCSQTNAGAYDFASQVASAFGQDALGIKLYPSFVTNPMTSSQIMDSLAMPGLVSDIGFSDRIAAGGKAPASNYTQKIIYRFPSTTLLPNPTFFANRVFAAAPPTPCVPRQFSSDSKNYDDLYRLEALKGDTPFSSEAFYVAADDFLSSIQWTISQNKIPKNLSLQTVEQVLKDARASWIAALGKYQNGWGNIIAPAAENFTVITGSPTVLQDGRRMVGWASLPSMRDPNGVYAYPVAKTTLFVDKRDARLVEADIIFNSRSPFSYTVFNGSNPCGGVKNTFDILDVTVHELGHALFGLDDLMPDALVPPFYSDPADPPKFANVKDVTMYAGTVMTKLFGSQPTLFGDAKGAVFAIHVMKDGKFINFLIPPAAAYKRCNRDASYTPSYKLVPFSASAAIVHQDIPNYPLEEAKDDACRDAHAAIGDYCDGTAIRKQFYDNERRKVDLLCQAINDDKSCQSNFSFPVCYQTNTPDGVPPLEKNGCKFSVDKANNKVTATTYVEIKFRDSWRAYDPGGNVKVLCTEPL